jgi:hypothetical protein
MKEDFWDHCATKSEIICKGLAVQAMTCGAAGALRAYD